MSGITWNDLAKDEQEALKGQSGTLASAIDMRELDVLKRLEAKGLVYQPAAYFFMLSAYGVTVKLGSLDDSESAAQQPAAESAPSVTITAAEFVAGGYAEKVRVEQCVITDRDGDVITLIEPVTAGYYRAWQVPRNGHVSYDFHEGSVFDKFIVAAAKPTGEPPPVAEETVTGDDDEWVARGLDDDDIQRTINQMPTVRAEYALKDELARLQRELAAANEVTATLRGALDEILQHADADVGGCDEINDADSFIDLLAGRLNAIRRLALEATATGSGVDANDGSGA